MRLLRTTLEWGMEESVEGFIAQYRPYAVTVELLPKTEGSPLLEVVANQKVLHLLERTSPYQAKPGKAQVIVNPMTETLQRSPEAVKSFMVPALSKMRVQGVVLELFPNVVIVDAGVPLVVTLLSDLSEDIALGDYISFESLSPIHGFVILKEEKRSYKRGRETDGEI
jgi:hypothetical protein